MKKFLIFLLFPIFTACINDSNIKIYQVEPLLKILPNDTSFIDKTDTMRVARGENTTFQFVLTSNENICDLNASIKCKNVGENKIGWVHDVYNTNPTHDAEDMITTPNNYYPDPIIDDEPEQFDGKCHRKTLWVDINIPRDAKSGLRKGTLTISGKKNGKEVKTKKSFYIQIYPVTLPEEQKLKVVNWYSPNNVHYLNNGKDLKLQSERYIELLKLIAEAGAQYGQNCWMIEEMPEIKLNEDSTDFYLDFTFFDKAIEMFKKNGNMKYFCNTHFGGRKDGSAWNDEMYFNIYTIQNKKLQHHFVPASDPRIEPFVERYYSQVEKHFREKGWLNICYQHLADEPDRMGTESQKSWSKVAAMIKKTAPGLKTIDASFEIIDNQDVSVVLLSDNIEELPSIPEGSERWMYTCTGPQGNFANRFIQLPLIKTRILHWINFKYNECGYLHWGFNYWNFSKDPLHDVTPSTEWPGGDCYIIYPGKEKVYPSIRLCTMREGIRDYDLLRMVESINPQKAKDFCNSIILGPDKYNMDIKHFYKVRREMLEFLSEKQKEK